MFIKKEAEKLDRNIFEFENVIFDINGTIVNNRRFYRILLAVLIKFGFGTKDNNLFLPTGGIALPCWAKALSRSSSLTKLVLKVDNVFLKILKIIGTRNPEIFPAVDEVLKCLYNENKNIFASTGGNTAVEKKCLEKLGISKYFRLIIGSDIAPKHNHIQYFAKFVDMPVLEFAGKTCSIGDGPAELMIASRYGIYGIGITHTLDKVSLSRVGAKKVVSNFTELLQ